MLAMGNLLLRKIIGNAQVIDNTTLPSELEMPVHLPKCRASCVSLPVPSRTSHPMQQQKSNNHAAAARW
ncbi:hypothetical protein DAPPUDRAFT_237998 [Daphnia pulex]|uniref:Uncharacterized protein n=1 Tax=Daphnia pulex TaxID=6669 RepID=E9G4Y7_DAPPU|nr:hypothetical protein DAPPUDRAFT_237998 [Daphnia pulex]|eukprot:EFX85383.1 hypothetical protein DAPPUDRAFT_237998 [Daphnia pulex]